MSKFKIKVLSSIIPALALTTGFAMASNQILFVCTGNTGRSVMAQYYAEHLAGSNPDLKIASAGVNIDPEELNSEKNAITVMNQIGINISKHKAHYLE